jgi:endonuclease/exonuclease/phosphatase family metal-dependent hydrolase
MSKKLKVFSFNLRVVVPKDGINCFWSRTERIKKVIADHAPDIIGFQEVNDDMRLWLRDTLSDYFLVGCGRNSSYKGEAMVVAYKKDSFELITLDTFWLSATPRVAGSRYGEDQSLCPRSTTVALLKHNEADKPFAFINTHLDHKGSTARLLGSVQLLQYISELNVPCILTGDFNATPDTREIQVITENDICGLKDLTAGLGGTFHGFGKNDPENMPKIDYIFTNMKADPNEAFAIEDKGIDGVYISDHYPVCAFVEVE